MRDPWLPEGEQGGDADEPDELEELFAPNREAWRGDVHPERESWCGEPTDESWRDEPTDEPWRGEEHLADWPEHAAGPEYWMFKAVADGA